MRIASHIVLSGTELDKVGEHLNQGQNAIAISSSTLKAFGI
jgi:hypothetical protein